MKKLFSKTYLSLATQMGFDPSKVQLGNQYSHKNLIKKQHYVLTSKDLYRLPEKQLRTMLKIPCPINNTTKEQKEELIVSFKKLRAYFQIDEQSVCGKCKFAQVCPEYNKKIVKVKNVKLDTLLSFFLCLNRIKQGNISILRWSAAYKTISSLKVFLTDAQKDSYQITLQKNLYDRAQRTMSVENNSHKVNEEKKDIGQRRFQLQR